MPEHLRALVFIMALTPAAFLLVQGPMTQGIIDRADYVRRRNLWLAFTLIAFLAHSFWIYIALVTVLVVGAEKVEKHRLALFFFLVLALPRIWDTIPLFGGLNELFDVDYVRLLSLTILLPTALQLATRPDAPPFGRLVPDRLLLLFLALQAILTFEDGTITSILRRGVFYAATDVLLPYYLTSRSLVSLRAFRDTMGSFVVGAIVLSPILLLECRFGWLLYAALDEAMGLQWEWNGYVMRGSNLRALATMGHPIVAGSVAMVATGFYLFLARHISKPSMRWLGGAAITAGGVAALSRAPWVGTAGIIVLYLALGPRAWKSLGKLALCGLACVPLLVGTRQGQSIIDHLPWIGTVDARNVEGREHLAEVAIEVFWRNPWLGRLDYLSDPDMEALRGSDNIIDVVNSYVSVGLSSGIIGLSLFVAFFLSCAFQAFRALSRVRDREGELHALGRCLVSVLIGLLFVISTMSFELIMPLLCWSTAGLCVGFANLVANGEPQSAPRLTSKLPRSPGRLLTPRHIPEDAVPERATS